MTFLIGDVVRVARSCMGNPSGANAIVIDYTEINGEPCWSLLFENGEFDGFSPGDIEAFGVQRLRHLLHLARYEFVSAMQLGRDVAAGVFAVVWSSGGRRR